MLPDLGRLAAEAAADLTRILHEDQLLAEEQEIVWDDAPLLEAARRHPSRLPPPAS